MNKESMVLFKRIIEVKRERLLEYIGDTNDLSDFGKGQLKAYEEIYALINILD